MPGYQTTIVEAQTDGTAVSGTTEGSLLPTVTKILLPSNRFYRIGQRIAVRATGRISNIATTPGTLTLKFKLGPTANIAAVTSSAISLNTTAKTNVGWFLDMTMTVRSIGSGTGATLFGQGSFQSESVVGSAAGVANSVLIQASAPAVGTGFDSSVANQIDLTATFSLTGNSMQAHTFGLEELSYTP